MTGTSALAKFRGKCQEWGWMPRNPFTPRGTSCPAKAATIVAVDIANASAKPFWNTYAESGVCTAVSSDGPFAVVHADTGLVNHYARYRTKALFMRFKRSASMPLCQVKADHYISHNWETNSAISETLCNCRAFFSRISWSSVTIEGGLSKSKALQNYVHGTVGGSY